MRALPPPRVAAIVAGLQLRRRVRDRSAIVQGVVAPVVLALIVSLAFSDGGSFSARIGVVNADGSPIGAVLVAGLAGADADGGVEFVPVATEQIAVALVDDGELGAAIVVPEGFADGLVGEPVPLLVLIDPGRELTGDVARSVAAQLAARVDTARVAVTSAVVADPGLAVDPGVDVLATDASRLEPPVRLGDSAFGAGFDPITYFAPSMAMLFAFLTLGAGARTIIVERREGTLARVRSAPVSDAAVLGGITASLLVLGVVSFVAVWAVTSLAFGADWGDPVAVLAVIVATIVAVAGISTLVAGVARTEAQADGASSIIAFGFALLGGGFVSPGALPDLLARVARLTPNGWALDAFAELGAGAAGIGAVLTPIAVLLAIGVGTGALGLSRARLGVG